MSVDSTKSAYLNSTTCSDNKTLTKEQNKMHRNPHGKILR